MKFVTDDAQGKLQEQFDDIMDSKKPSAWRSIICPLDRSLYIDPQARSIATTFLEKEIGNLEGTAYWLKSGHIVFFFQGRVAPVDTAFRNFTARVNEERSLETSDFKLFEMGRQAGWFEDEWEQIKQEIETIYKREDTAEKQKNDPVKHGESHPAAPNKKPAVNRVARDKKIPEEIKRKQEATRNARKIIKCLVITNEPLARKQAPEVFTRNCELVLEASPSEAITIYTRDWPEIVFIDTSLKKDAAVKLIDYFCGIDPYAYIVTFGSLSDNVNMGEYVFLGAKGFVGKPLLDNKDRIYRYINDRNEGREN